MNYIDKKLAEFDEIIGEKHYKICEGKNCVCHKELKSFLKQALEEQREEIQNICEGKMYQPRILRTPEGKIEDVSTNEEKCHNNAIKEILQIINEKIK